MTSEEMLIVKILRETYGDSLSLYQMYRTIAPRIFEMLDCPEDIFQLLWMNFSGGDTAEVTAKRIVEELK